jgi:D-3-phosphoglycerate dehydrogenase
MKILITDTLFVNEDHENKLKKAGFEIVRNPNPKLNEDELIEALKDIDGYIVGGLEHPSDKAISSAPKLKCVAVTAADWQAFLPGWRAAVEKEIAIGNTPGANTYAVAEYTLAQMLALVRELPSLSNTGKSTFSTTKSLQDLSVGVVGAGRIGETMISMLRGLGVKQIFYWNRTRKFAIESRWGVQYLSLDELCSQADIVTNHVATPAGQILNSNRIKNLKNGAVLISNGGHGVVDYKALKSRLEKGELKFAEDETTKELADLPTSVYYHSNSSSAFNTESALNLMSEICVDFIIDVLKNNDRSSAVA